MNSDLTSLTKPDNQLIGKEEKQLHHVQNYQEDSKALTSPCFEIIDPIFLDGSSRETLLSNATMVGISVLPDSPLLSTSGSWKLISFLASLPNPSVIFIGDYLNRHNVKAFRNLEKQQEMSDEEAIKTAMKSGEMFFKYLNDAVEQLETDQKDKVGKITVLGWADIEGHEMKQHQDIVYKHYKSNKLLKEKIGM